MKFCLISNWQVPLLIASTVNYEKCVLQQASLAIANQDQFQWKCIRLYFYPVQLREHKADDETGK